VKRIAILGSTGSIGQSALAVVDAHPDRLQVVGLAAGENAERLAAQIAQYRPRVAAMATGAAIDRLQQSGSPPAWRLRGAAATALVAVASHPDVDLVLCASSGTEALESRPRRDRARPDDRARQQGNPRDGRRHRHRGRRRGRVSRSCRSTASTTRSSVPPRPGAREVRRLVLTASGGRFRGRVASELSAVSADDALKHPTWRMGARSRSIRRR
jgi:1-deoxy-D-xylulose-5-phosphate reductoisomerase